MIMIEEQISGSSYSEAAKHWLNKAQITTLVNISRQNFEVCYERDCSLLDEDVNERKREKTYQ